MRPNDVQTVMSSLRKRDIFLFRILLSIIDNQTMGQGGDEQNWPAVRFAVIGNIYAIQIGTIRVLVTQLHINEFIICNAPFCTRERFSGFCESILIKRLLAAQAHSTNIECAHSSSIQRTDQIIKYHHREKIIEKITIAKSINSKHEAL